jgi:hypothetical protein
MKYFFMIFLIKIIKINKVPMNIDLSNLLKNYI